MTKMRKSVKAFLIVFAALFVFPAAVVYADPCLIVYPDVPAKYHYDVNEYYTVGYGHPLYDPMYDRGGEVLIDINTGGIAYNIYQIPYLTGFEMSTNGQEGYFFIGSSFNLFVDGFSNAPTTYPNIILVFDTDPYGCTSSITVDGIPVTGDTYAIGDLTVSTPTTEGNNYSDTVTKAIKWLGCYGVRMWAFADENNNGIRDGGECFTAFSHDSTVPVESTSWGAVKTLYKD